MSRQTDSSFTRQRLVVNDEPDGRFTGLPDTGWNRPGGGGGYLL